MRETRVGGGHLRGRGLKEPTRCQTSQPTLCVSEKSVRRRSDGCVRRCGRSVVIYARRSGSTQEVDRPSTHKWTTFSVNAAGLVAPRRRSRVGGEKKRSRGVNQSPLFFLRFIPLVLLAACHQLFLLLLLSICLVRQDESQGSP